MSKLKTRISDSKVLQIIIGLSLPLPIILAISYPFGLNPVAFLYFYPILVLPPVLICLTIAILISHFVWARDLKITDDIVEYKKGFKEYQHNWTDVSSWKIVGKVVHMNFSNGDKVIFKDLNKSEGIPVLEKCMSPELIHKKR